MQKKEQSDGAPEPASAEEAAVAEVPQPSCDRSSNSESKLSENRANSPDERVNSDSDIISFRTRGTGDGVSTEKSSIGGNGGRVLRGKKAGYSDQDLADRRAYLLSQR